jgi:REP element-mobilizing transposase RayT
MPLNDAGKIVADEWTKTAEIRQEIEMDEWVVMPNHLHGIVVITGDSVGAHGHASLQKRQGPGDRALCRSPKSIGAMIAGFKSATTKRINEFRQTPGVKLWQRNYCEHVIRNEHDLAEIREYIHNNPLKWESDTLLIPT